MIALMKAQAWLLLFALAPVGLFAITPRELAERLDRGEQVTLIDVRPSSQFESGHIPGAINIPSPLLSAKQLPPLGKVIAYGDGLGRSDEATAAEVLSRKPGIQAIALTGGFAAWESFSLPTTRPPGLLREMIPLISYQQLVASTGAGIAIIDLRGNGGELDVRPSGRTAPPQAQNVTDLRALLPKARIVASRGEVRGASRIASQGAAAAAAARVDPAAELLVLIDQGDGQADELAQLLRASGNRRVVVLAGGEETLRHRGRTGMGRVSQGSIKAGDDEDPEN
jgi:rhodanese-related sulfurtransferase